MYSGSICSFSERLVNRALATTRRAGGSEPALSAFQRASASRMALVKSWRCLRCKPVVKGAVPSMSGLQLNSATYLACVDYRDISMPMYLDAFQTHCDARRPSPDPPTCRDRQGQRSCPNKQRPLSTSQRGPATPQVTSPPTATPPSSPIARSPPGCCGTNESTHPPARFP